MNLKLQFYHLLNGLVTINYHAVKTTIYEFHFQDFKKKL